MSFQLLSEQNVPSTFSWEYLLLRTDFYTPIITVDRERNCIKAMERESTISTYTFAINGKNTDIAIRSHYSENFGDYVWPSARYLGELLCLNSDFIKGRRILELGCGPGLPGIVASKLGAEVVFTDKSSPTSILQNCRENAFANGVNATIVGDSCLFSSRWSWSGGCSRRS